MCRLRRGQAKLGGAGGVYKQLVFYLILLPEFCVCVRVCVGVCVCVCVCVCVNRLRWRWRWRIAVQKQSSL